MQLFPSTVIWRHHRENLKKCSLRGLETRSDFKFFTYPHNPALLEKGKGYILLSLNAPPLSFEDSHLGLFLVDATWRYAEKMLISLKDYPALVPRSLPSHFRTAYPRRQVDCSDPERGLASIEALYLSYFILGRKTDYLLDNYYWKEAFLEKNKAFIDLK